MHPGILKYGASSNTAKYLWERRDAKGSQKSTCTIQEPDIAAMPGHHDVIAGNAPKPS
jgi:hypothetical protein